MRSNKPLILGINGLTALGTSLAFAGAGAREQSENDAVSLSKARISLTQAIAAAESHVQGRAVSAELEGENGTLVYDVEVVKGSQATDVKVNSSDGRVVSAQTDQADHEAEGHEGREGEDD
jgi:hypothetical protein